MERIQQVMCNIECSGEGDGVVLLHGWGQNLQMMRLVQNELKATHRVINLDLPGFGQSEEPPQPWGIEEYAAFLHAVIQRYELRRVVLIAHSFGARIALFYAAHYPVQAMVLSGAAGLRAPLSLARRMKQGTHRLLKKLHLPSHGGSSDYRQASACMRQVLVKSIHHDAGAYLPQIMCPVLLVWGSEDQQTPLWMGRRMAELLPHARLLIYRHEDHFAYYRQGFRFVKDVCAFLGCSPCA